MRANFLCGVCAVLLLGSLTACSGKSAEEEQSAENSTASYHTSMEKNGLHDATAPDTWQGRTASVKDGYHQDTPNENFHARNGKTLSKDGQNAVEQGITATEKLAEDAKNGIQDAGRDASRALREAGRDVQEKTKQAQQNAANRMEAVR